MEIASLIEEVANRWRIQLKGVTPVEGGADAYARAFNAVSDTGDAFFVKTKATFNPGLALSAALRRAGITEVLAPLPTLTGEIGARLNDGVLLIYPWVSGHNGFERSPALDCWRKVGAALRKIHDSRVDTSRLATETFVVPGVAQFRNLMERSLAQAPGDEVEQAMGKLFKTQDSKIQKIIRETERLGEVCRRQESTLVPCHTDIHMGNVLIEDSGDVHLIDWDAPRLAPRECDLMFFVDGGILARHGQGEQEAFFTGYGLHELNPTLISYYKHERRLSDIVSFAHEALEMPDRTLAEREAAVQWFERQLSN